MVNSKHTAPHVTLHDEVEVSKLWDNRNGSKKCNGIKARVNLLAIRGESFDRNCEEIPSLEYASLDDANQEIVYKHYYNIGIATDTDHVCTYLT